MVYATNLAVWSIFFLTIWDLRDIDYGDLKKPPPEVFYKKVYLQAWSPATLLKRDLNTDFKEHLPTAASAFRYMKYNKFQNLHPFR